MVWINACVTVMAPQKMFFPCSLSSGASPLWGVLGYNIGDAEEMLALGCTDPIQAADWSPDSGEVISSIPCGNHNARHYNLCSL